MYADARLGPAQWQAYQALQIRSHVSVPIHCGASWVGVLTLNDTEPREWTDDEVALLDIVADRTWLAADYARLINTLNQRERELATAYRRAVLINRIGLSTRLLDDPVEVQQIAVDVIAEALSADRCASIVVDNERDLIKYVVEWKQPELPARVGEFKVSALLKADTQEMFPTGAPAVIPDAYLEPWFANLRPMLEAMKIRAILLVPFYSDGQVVSLFGVYMSEARNWTTDEVGFVEAVAAQVRSASEASRHFVEAKALAERETLINRIGSAVRSHADPAAINASVVQILGSELGLDRCFYSTYDVARDYASCLEDWHRADIASVAGSYIFSTFQPFLAEFFSLRQTVVINDTMVGQSEVMAENLAAYQFRSVMAVPLYDCGELVAALYVGMSDGPRVWTSDEVTVVEQVATLTRAAIDSARAALRERAIAARLQEALQPTIEDDVTGLDLRQYYQPALDEANIGGDFYDVFSLEPGVYALVVGDLSGKGLAAATQVSIVRNMLRYALYTSPTIADAVAGLNNTIVNRELLTGFATVFAGRYDTHTRELTYVNCGQEPALISRVHPGGRTVECLPPTSPVLGTVVDPVLKQETIQLRPGDAVVVFTDGLTEVGQNRSDQGGVERLTAVVRSAPPETTAAGIVDMIVDTVGAQSQIGIRDDQCLLVAVVG